jgi:hypothetical protein
MLSLIQVINMKLEEFEKLYETKSNVIGGMMLFPPETACEFIIEGIARGYKLLGIDAIKILNQNSVQPSMEYSNDVDSFSGSPENFLNYTLELIEKGAKQGFWFEVIFDENGSV